MQEELTDGEVIAMRAERVAVHLLRAERLARKAGHSVQALGRGKANQFFAKADGLKKLRLDLETHTMAASKTDDDVFDWALTEQAMQARGIIE